jgi:release factor glutamine methyltransferase
LDLLVDRRVLIPRPETEQVTAVALAELDRLAGDHGSRAGLIAVDLGTGSGAIALAIAAERTGVEVWATDLSAPALPDDLRGRVDLVVSNPPYIASGEMTQLEAQVSRWEPRLALEAGPTGLEALEAILNGAPAWLRPGGVVVLEIAPHQAESALAMARKVGLTEAEVHPDLAGRERTLVARRAP